MKRKSDSTIETIYDNNRLDMFVMAVSHLMDIGFRNAVKIKDKDIAALEGNGLMTQSFVQDLVKLSREISLACSSPTELIVFCNKHEIFDCGDVTRKRLKEILCNYVINDSEAADMSYIREVLYDFCGCDDDELKAIGLDWAICEDYYDDDEEE